MLLEPGAVALDLGQGVEVAEDIQDLLEALVLGALDRVGESRVDLPLGVGAGGREHVVLALVEHVEGVAAVVDAALEPARRAGEDVLLAPEEEVLVVLAVEQVILALAVRDKVVGQAADQLTERGLLGDRLPDLVCNERRGADRVQLAERVAVIGQSDLATSWRRIVLSPSNVVKTSVSAMSSPKRFSVR